MPTRTIAFRLNSKNKEDQEIMDWLDDVVYNHKIYDSLTEAVKWSLLSFARGEVRVREETSTIELMQMFVKDYAERSKVNNEKIVQDTITQTLAAVLGATIGHQGFGYPQMQAPMTYVPMQAMPVNGVPQTIPAETVSEASKSEVMEKEEKAVTNLLGYTNTPMDDGTAASLAAMFADGDDD